MRPRPELDFYWNRYTFAVLAISSLKRKPQTAERDQGIEAMEKIASECREFIQKICAGEM